MFKTTYDIWKSESPIGKLKTIGGLLIIMYIPLIIGLVWFDFKIIFKIIITNSILLLGIRLFELAYNKMQNPEKNDTIKYDILTQGAIEINQAYIHQRSETVVAIFIDMKTKRADILSVGCDDNNNPTIMLEANEESVFLKKDVEREKPTEISFPEFKNWDVWSVNVSKYTVFVCLVKRGKF